MRFGDRKILGTLATAACLVVGPARAETSVEATVRALPKPVVDENRDRLVDQAALQAQGEAIAKLQTLLKKYVGSVQEPLLLGRLAEAQQQDAAIRFRIAHGRAHRSGKAVELGDFKKTIKASIATLDALIAKFPSFENIEEAWFLRGKAFEEIEDKANARKNYLHLVDKWPDALQAPAAHMALAQFAIDENKHAEAIAQLEKVERRPTDPQYPFALYKLAWSHYNLKNIPAALGFLERHIKWYSERIKNTEGVPDTSDVAIRDNSVNETALFYVEGIELRHPDYSSTKALAYFRGLEKGPALGRVMGRFARLLRAHGKEAELVAWKDLVLKEEIERAEAIEVVMTWFDDRLNRRKYLELQSVAQDVERVIQANRKVARDWESYRVAVDTLIGTAQELQKIVIKNKQATELASYSAALAGLYMSITRILDAKDPRIPGVHYNLAETLFEIKDYPGATEHYRWVVDNWTDSSTFDLENASLRAIAARYEILRNDKFVVDALEAKALPKRDAGRVETRVDEWVAWIDAHAKRFGAPKASRFKVAADFEVAKARHENFQNFEFEANRSLYSQGQPNRAVARFLEFASASPDSKFAIPSAALALDSRILTNDWKLTHELARDLGREKTWKGGEFATRLAKVEADAWFKILEIKVDGKDMGDALAAARECLSRYGGSERYPDCMLMAAKIELRQGREVEAIEYLDRLVKERPDAEAGKWALLERARISERNYRFANALADYVAFLARDGNVSEVAPRVLPLAWLADRDEDLRLFLARPGLCEAVAQADDRAGMCDRMQALLVLTDASYRTGETKLRDGKYVLENFRKFPESSRAIWALAALANDRGLGFADRLELLGRLAEAWDRLDGPMQSQLQGRLVEVVKSSLERNRKILVTSFPLKPERRAIGKRLDRVKELESETVRLVKLPWTRLKTEVLVELAAAYTDIGDGLRALPAPTGFSGAEVEEYKQTLMGLSMPFDEKAVELRAKAFEVASEAGIDDSAFSFIAELYLKDNPSKSSELEGFRRPASVVDPKAKPVDRLDRLLPAARWSRFDAKAFAKLRAGDADDRARLFYWTWRQAYDAGNSQFMAYMVAEAKKAKALGEVELGILGYLTLERSGARAEALAALENVRASADEETRGVIAFELVQAYYRSGSKARVGKILEDMTRDVEKKRNVYGRLSREDQKVLAEADGWAKGRAVATQAAVRQEASDAKP